ncbi:hypothetical protein CYMTET_54890 [Cymbomonas tetramitiformis]|uniref:Uncharacterized protein n=1 Tax=Cymbomonas tetramitiformis TaxID=36881 RepID=A0AAE0BF69_9CHLO|nr:hypothetical protein CYMTET_54890 [Cymbomonas tetramitiformis]
MRNSKTLLQLLHRYQRLAVVQSAPRKVLSTSFQYRRVASETSASNSLTPSPTEEHAVTEALPLRPWGERVRAGEELDMNSALTHLMESDGTNRTVDWHAWQAFVAALPPLVMVGIAQLIHWDEAELLRRSSDEKAAHAIQEQAELPELQQKHQEEPGRQGEAAAAPAHSKEKLEQRVVELEAAVASMKAQLECPPPRAAPSAPGTGAAKAASTAVEGEHTDTNTNVKRHLQKTGQHNADDGDGTCQEKQEETGREVRWKTWLWDRTRAAWSGVKSRLYL